MPRIKSLDPRVLRQQAQRRMERSQQLQKAFESRLQNPQSTAKDGGDRKEEKKSSEAKLTALARSKGDTFSDQKRPGEVLETLDRETTFSLTGSKLFWQMNDLTFDTGSWRR